MHGSDFIIHRIPRHYKRNLCPRTKKRRPVGASSGFTSIAESPFRRLAGGQKTCHGIVDTVHPCEGDSASSMVAKNRDIMSRSADQKEEDGEPLRFIGSTKITPRS